MFLNNPGRSELFFITRNDIMISTEHDFFEICISAPELPKLPAFTETLVRLFSPYSGFIFFEDLVNFRFNKKDMMFTLVFVARTFAILHEGAIRYIPHMDICLPLEGS